MLSRIGIKYPSKLHSEKVAAFLSPKARLGAIILAKGTESLNRDNTDTELEFRQESNFLYLTGVQESDYYYIYDIVSGISYLIAPDLDLAKAVWKGPTPSDKELLKLYDVDRIVRYSAFLDLLKYEISPQQIHGWNRPEKVHPLGDKALEHELEHYIAHRLVPDKKKKKDDHHHHHHNNNKCPGDDDKNDEDNTLLEALILARVNKTPVEISLSREATRITCDAHRLVMKSARAGMYEYQLEAMFRYECARQGAKAQAYLPIIGAATNAAYLHYTRNSAQIKDGDMVLIDAACEADCYVSDVTRTFPVNGRFTSEQGDIYNLVLKMQNSVISSMHQGVEWSAMATLSQKIGVLGLKKLGILHGDDTDLIESNIIKSFYPHGTGHLLGLNVHDDGLGLVVQKPIKSKRLASVEFLGISADNSIAPPPSTRRVATMGTSTYAVPSTKLEPGMLLTVEPGIYFNPAQIDIALSTPYLAQYLNESVLRRYMPVGGVRIEDVILIKPDGTVENITTAPKDPREIERIMQEGQRAHQESQHEGGEAVEKKYTEQLQQEETPRGIKKRFGVFKKLLKALRSIF
ncbi:hypothetical protein BGZ93_007156 [Podila epicladia]|nr:hypothetical protein BGZ92_007830 [Podila epicladia]KAG0094474.1 hypothetical protein BGZ93_007156 [Podila epicladia]